MGVEDVCLVDQFRRKEARDVGVQMILVFLKVFSQVPGSDDSGETAGGFEIAESKSSGLCRESFDPKREEISRKKT